MAFGGVAGGKLPGVLGGKSVDNFGTVHCREKAVTGAGKGVDFREIRQGKKHRQRSWKRTGSSRTGAALFSARSYRTRRAAEAQKGHQSAESHQREGKRHDTAQREIRASVDRKRERRRGAGGTKRERGEKPRPAAATGRGTPTAPHRSDQPPAGRATDTGAERRARGGGSASANREGGGRTTPQPRTQSRERRRKGPAGGPRAKGPKAPQCATSGPNHARWERPEHDRPPAGGPPRGRTTGAERRTRG